MRRTTLESECPEPSKKQRRSSVDETASVDNPIIEAGIPDRESVQDAFQVENEQLRKSNFYAKEADAVFSSLPLSEKTQTALKRIAVHSNDGNSKQSNSFFTGW